MDFTPLWLTLKLAFVVTTCLFLIAVPLAYGLYITKSRLKPIGEALVSLPLILPPTVLGFYLLLLFNPQSGLGLWLNDILGFQVSFSFSGLVIASIIFSLPFMVHPLLSGMNQVSKSIIEAAMLMGKTPSQILFKVILPNMKPSVLAGLVLTFAHTIGEFGVVLMIGGSIPGETKVASIAIYEEVEKLNFEGAHFYSFLLFLLSFIVLVWIYGYQRVKAIHLG